MCFEEGSNRTSCDSSFNSIKSPYKPWTHSELKVLWEYPDLTAEDLANILDGRTPQAIRKARQRYGRYNAYEIPLCQKCHEHPVDVATPRATRLGLCSECFIKEETWRIEHAKEIRRKKNALRQRRFKARHKRK